MDRAVYRRTICPEFSNVVCERANAKFNVLVGRLKRICLTPLGRDQDIFVALHNRSVRDAEPTPVIYGQMYKDLSSTRMLAPTVVAEED